MRNDHEGKASSRRGWIGALTNLPSKQKVEKIWKKQIKYVNWIRKK
jgi:hypothetical protein